MSINYDFIVVGGGASGAILSATLAEKGKTLLIERGANHSLYFPSKIRQGWPQIAGIAWNTQRAEDSNHWTGTANILGGGSAVNGGACWRAKAEVFEALGFDYEGEAQEAYEILEAQLCDPVPDNDYNQAFRSSMADIGTDLAVDEELTGRGYTQDTDSPGGIYVNRARSIFDPATGFRRPSSHLFEQGSGFRGAQANLTVMLLTIATRVLIDEGSMKAQGVELTSEILGNFTARIRKNGKVFLNAGVFETPKLLMLSGVGPEAVLKAHGIPVLIDNPSVGQNLVDRKSFYISIPQLTTTIDGDDTTILDYVGATENMWLSLTHKLAVPWGNAAFGCVACAAQDRTVACQEQLLAALVLYGNGAVPGTQLLELVGLFIAQRNPRARGHVELSSSNFRDNLRVFDGWNTRIEDLSEDALHDLSVIVDGAYELVVDLVRNTSFIEKLGHPVSNRTGEFAAETVLALEELKGLFSNLSNECKVSAAFGLNCSSWTECTPTLPSLPLDREALTTVIFNNLASSQHGAGTCQVGKVVNKRSFQVLGVQSLHIADLSILDAATDVHPMLTAMAIGALAGNQIDSLGKELPESFPVVFAIVMVVLATLFSLVVIGFQFCTSSKLSSKNSETGGSVPLPIWLKQSLPASGPLPTCSSHAFVSASNADAATNTADVPPEEWKIAPVTPNLLAWHRLCCSYKMKSGEDTVTLSNASGAMRQGELVAIMGASGSGKSTLLDILSGRKSIGNVTGTLSVVGTEINDAKEASKLLREVSAYIPQQEAFYPTQSPQEAVLFTARLKLGAIFTQDDAQSLLDAVGLKEEVSNRPIGGTLPGGIVIRGLSGGERKRLALACAVAIKPRLLFLDEITSGLDSENAMAVVKLLKNLCQIRQVAAALVIHQPSGELFELFDSLVLLSSGKCVFSGSLEGLPDFYRDTFKTDYPAQHMVPNRLLKEATAGEAEGFFDEDVLEQIHRQGLLETKALTSRPRIPPTTWVVFTTVFTRNLTNHYVRNLGNVAARILLYTALSAIDGAIFWQVAQPESEGGALPLASSLVVIGAFTFLIMISFLLPFAMIPIFVFDKKFFAAESALGLYSPIIYCISQALLETWILTICALCEACVIIPMGGFWNPVLPRWGAFFTVCGSLIASGLAGSGLVLVCTMVFPSQDLAFLAGSGVVTVALGVSGGFVPFPSMEDWISWLQWVSPCKYSLQALAIGQFGNSNSEIILEVSALNTPNSVSANIGVLLGFYVVFTVGTVLALSRQREVR